MKKIFYLNKKEVRMGDKIDLNGTIVTITPQLIDDLPNLFKVEEEQEVQIVPEYVECIKDMGGIRGARCGEILKSWYNPAKGFPYRFASKNGENGYNNSESFYKYFKPSTKEAWLLQEAKRRYPKGTKFKNPPTGKICIASGIYKVWPHKCNSIENITEEGLPYCEGQWAEIVKPLFVTEDGVEIFNGDDYWVTPKHTNNSYFPHELDNYPANRIANNLTLIDTSPNSFSFFSSREAAEEYIAKHKEKTLEDYENELLGKKDIVWPSYNSVTIADIYRWLRKNDPKLYWTKVLQLIADNLNEGWKSRVGNSGYFIYNTGEFLDIKKHASVKYDLIYFKSTKIAEKVIEIMKDKIYCIYKH